MGSVNIVKASAGSGKTYRLSYEYVKRVVGNPELYRHILAVTFTNKAADEMKRRIIGEINDLANGRTTAGKLPAFAADLEKKLNLSSEEIMGRARKARTKILHDYSRFSILTIDKFFQRIIRAFIRELGGDVDFTLELQTDSILDTAADRLIEDTLTDETLNKWITGFVEEQIADGKRWDIKKEITGLGREIFKEHYRTDGKTELSKEEIFAAVSASMADVYKCKTRMQELAGKAVEIINERGLDVSDFFGGRYSFALYFYKVAAGNIEDKYSNRVVDALKSDEKWCASKSPLKAEIDSLIPLLKPILAELCRIYDENIAFINTVNLLRANYRTYAVLSDLSNYVATICRERGIMLIQETNHIINRLVDGNDAPFIFEKAGNTYSHYMMDEFQDTSLTQWENFRPLLSNALSQSGDSPVLIVGDVKQSIYRWRGGDWEILGSGVAESFRDIAEHSLEKNYRSGGNIIEFNNNLIAGAVAADSAFVDSKLEEAEVIGTVDREESAVLRRMVGSAYADLRQEPGTELAQGKGYVRIVNYSREQDDETEGIPKPDNYIIKLIEELQDRGYRPGDIAMLVRSNSEGVQLANMLLEYKSANPGSNYSYDIVTREALLLANSPAIQFVTACFRIATGKDVSISQAVYKRYSGADVEAPFTEKEQLFISSLRSVSLEEAFERIVMEHKLGDTPANVAYLQAYHDKLLSFANGKISDIPLFLKWWDESGVRESIELPDNRSAMTVITIHKSKGLQYPVVIMPYASWKITPSWKTLMWVDTDRAPFAALGRMPVRFQNTLSESYFAPYYYKELVYSHIDNINLLYVAVTRAENELFLFVPKDRKERKEGRLNTVADLILDGLKRDGRKAFIGDMEGKAADDGEDIIYEFGQAALYTGNSATENGVIGDAGYPAYSFDGKLRLHRANERYEGEGTGALSPRHYGRIMHKVFESISSSGQIVNKLAAMQAEGLISETDSLRIGEMIKTALCDPLIASWYDGSWDEIRNENDIILPSTGTLAMRRPDRVLLKEGKTVVIDYKFGQKENKYYDRQVAEYMNLLRGMGYDGISGYIWYVEMGKVVAVTT